MNKLLFIQGRNLGDAVISTGLINSIGKSFSNQIDVFTRPQFKTVFRNNPFIDNIYYANFPMGTQKNFNITEATKLLIAIKRLRNAKYSTCVNTFGDFRENTIGWLIKPERNVTVVWEGAHPYNMLIRRGCYKLTNEFVGVPETVINVYDANVIIAKELGCRFIEKPKIYVDEKPVKNFFKNVIAIHPTASQKSKLWEFRKWKSLMISLKEAGCFIWIFVAPDEKEEMERIFKSVIDNERIIVQAGDLEEFFLKLSYVKLSIGLDSFSVHAAYAVGIPSIMLNGSNDYRVWQPPNSKVIFKGNACNFYPCYNKPKCIGKDFEYVCMKAIEVGDVLKACMDLNYAAKRTEL